MYNSKDSSQNMLSDHLNNYAYPYRLLIGHGDVPIWKIYHTKCPPQNLFRITPRNSNVSLKNLKLFFVNNDLMNKTPKERADFFKPPDPNSLPMPPCNWLR